MLDSLVTNLNTFGADGWELASVTHSSDVETVPIGGSVQRPTAPKWTANMKRPKRR